MKVIAMYLPQFHKVKENDEWWGEGFTDWVSAKKANPLFEGHYQPHIPLSNNYYNLLEKSILKWQSELMHKFGVDGMCFYHYWFENGRKILEKPAENLLEWKDVDMPFCFSWANETWARSWGNIKESNVWTNIDEPESKSDKIILLNQNYGNKSQWKKHFDYLIPFFKDSRYIKIQGKPLFHIYKTRLVDCLKEMLEYWNELAVENDFPGIFVIGSNCVGAEREYLDYELIAEPQSGNKPFLEHYFSDEAKRLDYEKVWNQIISMPVTNSKTICGGFVGYDDTPRRGKEGVIIDNATPNMFGLYLAKLMKKNEMLGNDLIFINAWNEWGEGMHLEPDEKYGYAFLEQINIAKENYKSCEVETNESYEINLSMKYRAEKYELYTNDLDIWMTLREKGKKLTDVLVKRGIKTVAVYGFGIMGRHLLFELENSEINCLYLIDKQKSKIHANLPVYLPEESLPFVDAIIISPYFYLKDIEDKMPYPSISLGGIIHESYSEK